MSKIIVVLLLIIYSSATAFASVNEIDVCKKLDVDGEYYLLTTNVESSGSCFTIGANNITLDGDGHYVNFSSLKYGNGVYNARHDNVTIKNINVNQINFSIPYSDFNDSYEAYINRSSAGAGALIDSKGINFYFSNNGLISNVTTNVSRESIQFYSSNNNTIINSTATSIRSAAIFIGNASNNKVINSRGISTTTDTNKLFEYRRRSAGIQLSRSNNNTIVNSTGIANIGMGIQLEGLNNSLKNSTGISDSNIGIDLYVSSNSILADNTAISDINYGLRVYHSTNNILDSNIAKSNARSGTYVDKSNNNTIINSSKSPIINLSVTQNPLTNKSIEPFVSNKNIGTILLLIVLLLIFIVIFRKK